MFQGKVSEAQLIDLMNQVAEMAADKNMKVEISKHKFDDEDDLDIDNLDLWLMICSAAGDTIFKQQKYKLR